MQTAGETNAVGGVRKLRTPALAAKNVSNRAVFALPTLVTRSALGEDLGVAE